MKDIKKKIYVSLMIFFSIFAVAGLVEAIYAISSITINAIEQQK